MKPLLFLLAGLNLLAAASGLAADAHPPARGWVFEDREGGLALQLDGQQVAEFVYRDYGLMVANPFGQEAMKQGAKSRATVKRGESFRLRFGAAIHQGPNEDVAALYQAFLLGNRVPRQRH